MVRPSLPFPGVAGFSAVRIFLHEELFHRHGMAFLQDVSRLLDVLHRQGQFAFCRVHAPVCMYVVIVPSEPSDSATGMSTMIVLFDACWRPDAGEPGEDLFLPGVHNSAWVQCPTHTVLRAFGLGEAWASDRLQHYVTAVVRRFATDPRVAIWDIYNEPTMRQSEHLILPRLAALNGWPPGKHPDHWLLDGVKLNIILSLVRQAAPGLK